MDEVCRDFVAFVRESCPYYADLYSQVPLNSRLADLPLVDHTKYWEWSNRSRRNVMTGPQIDGIVVKTGGTTSEPKTIGYSQVDLQRTASLLAKGLMAGGVRTGDRIANMFYAGDLYASFLLHVTSVLALPIPVVHVPIGGLTSVSTAADLIVQTDVTVLLSTATFLVKIAAYYASIGQVNERVHCILFGGEPIFDEQVAALRSVFPRASIKSCIYGSMDAGVLAVTSSDDKDDPNVQKVLSEAVFLEIVRQDDNNQVIECNDEIGMLVATNLHRTLCPAIRYPTGDRAAWVDREKGIFRLLGRAGVGVRVGPVSIDVTELRRLTSAALAQQNTPFHGLQSVLRRTDSGLDQLELLVESQPADTQADAKAVEQALYSERPMFKQHVEKSLVAPLAVRFVHSDEFHLAPGSQKMLSVVEKRF